MTPPEPLLEVAEARTAGWIATDPRREARWPGPSAGAVLASGRVRATLTMLGPAFVAAVAYVDPGNFATNLQGGARFGYELMWVVLVANLVAMLVQYLSAKLGVVTGR